MYSTEIVGSFTLNGGSTTPDSNGLPSLFMRVVAGSCPTKVLTITGTVAKNNGFEIGKTYLLQIVERGTHVTFGTVYNYVNLGEVNGMQIVDLIQKLGRPSVFEVAKPKAMENYQRKTDSVKGALTIEEEKGNFKKATLTSSRGSDNTESQGEGQSGKAA